MSDLYVSDKSYKEMQDEIERLTNEVSYLRTREKNHQNYIAGLEGDLEVMRLQRDATQSSRCPTCERLRAALQNIHDHAIDNGEDCAYLDARKALREDEDE